MLEAGAVVRAVFLPEFPQQLGLHWSGLLVYKLACAMQDCERVSTSLEYRCHVREEVTHKKVSRSPWSCPFPGAHASYLSNTTGLRDPLFTLH